jgi:hypothetical protein
MTVADAAAAQAPHRENPTAKEDMSVLESQLNPRSADFQANAEAMRGAGRGPAGAAGAGGRRWRRGGAQAKHVARGKLPPRERVQMLLDPGTPFLEIAPLAAHGMYKGRRAVRRHHRRHRPGERASTW